MLKKVKYEHLQGSYQEMAEVSAVPLWEIYDSLVATTPTPMGVPHIWRYQDLRPLLLDAGTKISAAEAERRVLALKNPGLDRPAAAQTLFAGLQLVMPGEIAEAHRHSQGAIRFVLESSGGYTAVEGERCLMRRGDFITTPSWCWHDHKNTGDGPLIWLDGLDVPMVNFFGAKFAEEHEQDQQPILRPDDDSTSRWGLGMRPLTGEHRGQHSPVFSYTYERACEALAGLEAGGDPHPRHGWKLVYSNPLTGGHALPTLSAFLQKLPAGMRTAPSRATEATIYAVAEGEGEASVGGTSIAFKPNDIFVAPNWTTVAIMASSDVTMFSVSDRAAQERLGIWREETYQD